MPGLATMLQIAFAPAPPPVVDAVEEIVVESTLETSSAFRIRLGIAQNDLGDWRFLQEDLFRPLVPVTVRVAAGTVPVPEALITGYVSQQDVTYGDEAGSSALEISGLDATHLMNLQEKVMPWPNLPDGAIAAAIFAQYPPIVPMVQPTAPTLVEPEGTTIQRGTDLRFLRRLARRNGFDVYVQPEPVTGIDQGFFRPRQTLGAPQAVLNVHMGSETNVAGFRVRYDMTQPTGAVAAGLDTMTKAPQPALAPVSVQPPMGVEPSLLRVLPPPVVRPVDTGEMRTAELQAYAQGIADRSSFAVVAEGEAGPDVGILRPGGLVAVRGLGRLHNGLYLVTRVRHRISDDGYVQSFEARRNAVTMTGAEPYVAL
jgi:phage protein D